MDCYPGAFGCQYSNLTKLDWIIVCAQDAKWQWSSDCGKSQKCVENLTGTAHCEVRQKALFEAREDIQAFSSPSSLQRRGCTPGTYHCSVQDTLTCDALGNWVESAYCGQDAICKEGPTGVAHFVPITSSSVVARQAGQTCTTPGAYGCGGHIAVRCDNGFWMFFNDCGNDFCKFVPGQDREPQCVRPPMIFSIPSPRAIEADTHLSVHQGDKCDYTGVYGCDGHIILQCFDGRWQFSLDCGNTLCVKWLNGKTECAPIKALGGAPAGTTTLLTVAKEAAATAKA
jgi:hypothetical protein